MPPLQKTFLRRWCNHPCGLSLFLILIVMESNTLKLEAPWHEVKEHIKEVNVHITDEDLEYEPGDEDRLLERLSGKLGKSKQDVKAWIESISYNKGIAG